MQLTRFLVTLGLCAASTQAIASREAEDPASVMADFNAEAIKLLETRVEARAPQKKCSIANARVRVDWYDIPCFPLVFSPICFFRLTLEISEALQPIPQLSSHR
jgi:hypothetical protein